jgi:hypothetical protein
MTQQATTLTILSSEEITVTSKPKGKVLITFNLIGKKDGRNLESIDGRKAYTQSTKSELFVLELVDELMDKTTNIVRISLKAHNKTEKERIKTGTRKLIARGLLIRIKREHYMVNPWFFVPQRNDQAPILLEWRRRRGSKSPAVPSSRWPLKNATPSVGNWPF